MKDERLKILELLQEGKLTKEEALELLEALDASEELTEDANPSRPASTPDPVQPSPVEPVADMELNSDYDRLFRFQKGNLLEVNLIGGGNIMIAPWQRDDVAIKTDKHFWNLFKLRYQEGAAGLKLLSWGGQNIRIQVPADLDLRIRTAGGDIHIWGVSGQIHGKTMGGDILLSNLKGSLDLVSLGGDIRITDSEVNGKVHTMGGDVTLINVRGEVYGSTLGGEVVRLSQQPENVVSR